MEEGFPIVEFFELLVSLGPVAWVPLLIGAIVLIGLAVGANKAADSSFKPTVQQQAPKKRTRNLDAEHDRVWVCAAQRHLRTVSELVEVTQATDDPRTCALDDKALLRLYKQLPLAEHEDLRTRLEALWFNRSPVEKEWVRERLRRLAS